MPAWYVRKHLGHSPTSVRIRRIHKTVPQASHETILHCRKWRPREVKSLAPCHTASPQVGFIHLSVGLRARTGVTSHFQDVLAFISPRL